MPTTPTPELLELLEAEQDSRAVDRRQRDDEIAVQHARNLNGIARARAVASIVDADFPAGPVGHEVDVVAPAGYRIVKRLTGYSHPKRVAQYQYDALSVDGEQLGGPYGRYFQAVSACHAQRVEVGLGELGIDLAAATPIADEDAEFSGRRDAEDDWAERAAEHGDMQRSLLKEAG